MMRRETLARSIVIFLLLLIGLAFGMGWLKQRQGITVRARMPELGGWLPGELAAVVGQPLRLRLTSDDVTHSFAIGQMDMPPVDIHPGEVSEITLTFDEPGRYTYYCTRWCGANHWRMRGTIEVKSDSLSYPTEEYATPLYIQLGLDIDAPHLAQVTPQAKLVPAADDTLVGRFVDPYGSQDYYRTHSPEETWKALRAERSMENLSDLEVWSVVAALWQANTTVQRLEQGKELYKQNCSACHGENGAGDGVFAAGLAGETGLDMAAGGHGVQKPADFTDPAAMLGASPALLQGKILRGGMGTGMPYWGPIFTEDQIWSLVEYLWTFQFETNLEVNP